MWRWIRNTFIVISLLICIAASFFWVRSLSRSESMRYESPERAYVVGSMDQRAVLYWSQNDEAAISVILDEWAYHSERRKPIDESLADIRFWSTHSFEFAGFRYLAIPQPTRSGYCFRLIVIPFFYIVSLTSLPPLWWIARGRRSRKAYRRKRGLCLGCGYDRRETKGDCPECGVAVAP